MTGIRVAITGASGLAGGETLDMLLAEDRIAEVISIGRRRISVEHPKLQQIVHTDFLDFSSLRDQLTGLDAMFWKLGISQMDVPEEEDYRRITYDFTVACAKLLQETSPQAVFHFITGTGTRRDGRQLWQRVKAQAEDDLMKLGLGRVVCYRPGLIWSSPGRKPRYKSEYVLMPLKWFGYWIKGISIKGSDYGKACLAAQFSDTFGILENRELRELADQYGKT